MCVLFLDERAPTIRKQKYIFDISALEKDGLLVSADNESTPLSLGAANPGPGTCAGQVRA